MSNLESLAIKHAKYSGMKRDIKRQIGVELSNHDPKGMDFSEVFIGDDKLSELDEAIEYCPGLAYQAVKILNRDTQWPECYGYDEVLSMYGCDSCNNARKLKVSLGQVGMKLGQIRGAITKAGIKLHEQSNNKG
tara:strand:+ start:72 stop:473 length:402 start_codon:yes stop_codon:yes gene_type:complete